LSRSFQHFEEEQDLAAFLMAELGHEVESYESWFQWNRDLCGSDGLPCKHPRGNMAKSRTGASYCVTCAYEAELRRTRLELAQQASDSVALKEENEGLRLELGILKDLVENEVPARDE
jgi:hypothetical protein